MSSPLDFQTEGPGLESHEGHIFFSFSYFFFSPHSLKSAQVLMNVFFFANKDRNFAIELQMTVNAPLVIKNWTDRLGVQK